VFGIGVQLCVCDGADEILFLGSFLSDIFDDGFPAAGSANDKHRPLLAVDSEACSWILGLDVGEVGFRVARGFRTSRR